MIPLGILIIPVQAGWRGPDLDFLCHESHDAFLKAETPQQGANPIFSREPKVCVLLAALTNTSTCLWVTERSLESHQEGELQILQQELPGDHSTSPSPLHSAFNLSLWRTSYPEFLFNWAHRPTAGNLDFTRFLNKWCFHRQSDATWRAGDLRNHTEIPHFIIKSNVRDWFYSLDNLGKG